MLDFSTISNPSLPYTRNVEMSAAKQYFTNTHTLLYSFLFSLPLFFIYEALIIISQPNVTELVRISVDVWMKTLFTALGVNAVSFSLLLVLVFGVFILYKERNELKKLQLKYFPILIFESLLYGIIVAYISSYLTYLILNVVVNELRAAHLFTKISSF